MPTIIAALRIRNESRWIKTVVESIKPICDRILIMDDFSDDGTPDICESLGCTVYRNAVPRKIVDGREVSDESAGKDFLLTKAYEHVTARWHNQESPYWLLAIDGDEVLAEGDGAVIQSAIEDPAKHCYSLKILYLWDRVDQWRVDKVYGKFTRPSLFRLMNPAFRYQRTPWGNGANFHCSSIPQEMLHHARPCDARLLHLGYLNREDRVRKLDWYNEKDVLNKAEDFYRHMTQGDNAQLSELPRIQGLLDKGKITLEQVRYILDTPPSMKLLHAGPLQLEPLA